MTNPTKDPDAPPSYTTSILNPQPTPTSRAQSLLDTLTLRRATTLTSTIHTAILPVLEARAARGIPHTVLALLPSDTRLLAPPPSREKTEFSFDSGGAGGEEGGEEIEVLGAEGEGKIVVVRLSGEENRAEFWGVRGVVGELERGLSGVLNEGRGSGFVTAPATIPEQGEAQKKKKKGFFGRRREDEKKAEGGGQKGVEEVDGDAGMVRVRVLLEEICLRTVSEFGLYDTVTRQAVVVRVDARC